MKNILYTKPREDFVFYAENSDIYSPVARSSMIERLIILIIV